MPIITFPVLLSENCSLTGIKVNRILPDISEEEKEIQRIKEELKSVEKGGKLSRTELSLSEKFATMVQNKKSSSRQLNHEKSNIFGGGLK